MKIALLILVVIVVVAVAAYVLFFPSDSHFVFSRMNGGGTVTFSRTGVSFQAGPTRYPANGFDHLEPYVARLLVPAARFKGLSVFTPDGMRGLGLHARDGAVHVGLNVDWRQEPQRETAIRAFFGSLGIAPSRDYLAGNGGVADALRILEYPVSGSTAEVTELTKRVLHELCGVAPTEALDIRYQDS